MYELSRGMTGNRLLDSLPSQEFSRHLRPYLELVSVSQGTVIYEARQTVEYAWFPVTALLSLVMISQSGDLVEAGVCGNEAMCGISILFGPAIAPYQVEVQIAGTALRCRAEVLTDLCEKAPVLQHHLLRYAYTGMMQLAQTVICNRFHSVRQRLSRWLLTAHDRAPSDQLPLTREILAGMIGARRPRVSTMVSSLQAAGLISAGRGIISIIDRAGLEAVSCECYQVIREELNGLFSRAG